MRLTLILGLAVTAWGNRKEFKNMTVLNNGSCELEDNNLERWLDSDPVEVYLAEYHLQHMDLSAWLGFSTSHMAVLFQNPRIRKWYVMDSFARSAETIANIIMPSISPHSPLTGMSWWQRLLAYVNGDFVHYLSWDNLGYVRMREDKTDEFQDMQHVGTTTGLELKKIREWVVTDFSKHDGDTVFTFDMWQIYNGSTNERVRKSRMCHDFIEDVLGRLKFVDTGDAHQTKVSMFRDSLNLNITEWEVVDIGNAKIRRDYQRFLRFFRNHVYEATRDLRYSRVTLSKLVKLNLPFILFLDGDKYVRMTLSEYSVINYCRMPMDFVKGKVYVPARLDDDRQQCFMPQFNVHDVVSTVRFTLSDYAIWLEQRIDDLLFGVDGRGTSIHLALIFETSILLIGLARFVRWLATRNSK